MTAYELADYIQENYATNGNDIEQLANMLRQQADRIAELEKDLEGCEYFLNQEKQSEPYLSEWSWRFQQQQKTKPLSDEEIAIMSDQILCYQIYDAKNSGVYEFARAIEAKVRGEK